MKKVLPGVAWMRKLLPRQNHAPLSYLVDFQKPHRKVCRDVLHKSLIAIAYS